MKTCATDKVPVHIMQGPPGYRCACGNRFGYYAQLAEHVRLSINCPRCGAPPTAMTYLSTALFRIGVFRWTCGHWIAKGDDTAEIRTTEENP